MGSVSGLALGCWGVGGLLTGGESQEEGAQ